MNDTTDEQNTGMQNTSAYERVARFEDLAFDDSCVIIADERLPESVRGTLPQPLLVHAGEMLKTLPAVERLAERVLERRAARPLTLVAVGGGSVGDAVGFLASMLLRGVDLWHVPTTLLAMVDSAHGGKTAVNLGAAKNQLGSFHTARRTSIVDEALHTLSIPRRRDGLVEMLKALWLGDADTTRTLSARDIERFSALPFDDVRDAMMNAVERAIAVKLALVREDPRETRGIRTVLNLGHTLGHGLELSAGLSHGAAVAWGMQTALALSADAGPSGDADTGPSGDAVAAGAGFGDVARRLLARQLYPLLVPVSAMPDRPTLRALLLRDKKRLRGTLRSVLLRDIGQPLISELLSPDDWIDAFYREHEAFLAAPVTVSLVDARRVQIAVQAGKSELNRALAIAALRTGRTRIEGHSDAADVRAMAEGLRRLGIPLREGDGGYDVDHAEGLEERIASSDGGKPRIVHCGEGGTTFRFLLAVAAMNRKQTTLLAAPSLLRRPHEPLLRALRNAGADIAPVDGVEGAGYVVRGWEVMPDRFSVDASQSSQFASAIALLSAGADSPFTLRLTGKTVSEPYLDMTLGMLETAGVECLRHGDLIAFNPSSRLQDDTELRAAPDASSEAVWRVAQFFEHPLLLPGDAQADGTTAGTKGGTQEGRLPDAGQSLQPDARLASLLDAIYEGQQRDDILLDITGTPDLLPVLAIASLRSSRPVRITGAAHARLKESNRIDGLASSLAALGITVQATADGLLVPARAAQRVGGAAFDTHDDHRLVMAGFLLSMISRSVTLTHPWAVAKSYPSFWDDARRAGWSVQSCASLP